MCEGLRTTEPSNGGQGRVLVMEFPGQSTLLDSLQVPRLSDFVLAAMRWREVVPLGGDQCLRYREPNFRAGTRAVCQRRYSATPKQLVDDIVPQLQPSHQSPDIWFNMPLLRRRLRCHYCNVQSRDSVSHIPKTYHCPHCDAVNHFDEVYS